VVLFHHAVPECVLLCFGDRVLRTVHVACVGTFVRIFVAGRQENNHLGSLVCKYFVLNLFIGTTFFFVARTLGWRDARLEGTLSNRGRFQIEDTRLAWKLGWRGRFVRTLAIGWRGRSVGAHARFVRTLGSCGSSVRVDARFVRTLDSFGRSVRADVTYSVRADAVTDRLLTYAPMKRPHEPSVHRSC